MFLRGKPLLIALLLHLLVALLYWTLIPLGMNAYRDHFGFTSHRDIGLGIAQFHLFWMFLAAQPLIAALRPLFAKLLMLAIPLAFATWTLMHNHPLRLLYFTIGPGEPALFVARNLTPHHGHRRCLDATPACSGCWSRSPGWR